MKPIYDDIGTNYTANRQADPRIAALIHAQLKGAKRILNIGGGTGSYEPTNADLVAVEPSAKMIAQRKSGAHPVVQAFAEALPFPDGSFTHAMTILSIHHWTDRVKAFGEINRVATERFVALTWNPAAPPFWLTRDYFPQFHAVDRQSFPGLDEFALHFDQVEMIPVPIPVDCRDGFLAAFWQRPEAYLNEDVRRSISCFARSGEFLAGLEKLQRDLESGSWLQRNKHLRQQTSIDAGYVLVSCKTRHATTLKS